jgi:hypothetical protein
MKQCTDPIGAGCSHIYRRIYRYNPEIHGDLYLYNIYLNRFNYTNLKQIVPYVCAYRFPVWLSLPDSVGEHDLVEKMN